MTDVVLGCTHYELVADRIRAALRRPGVPEVTLHGSAEAVAAQALRRVGAEPAPSAEPSGTLTVLLGGRPAGLPVPALAYPQGASLGAVSAAL